MYNKKMINKIINWSFLILIAFFIFGCGKKQTEGTAYGITHKDYVGMAKVTVVNEQVNTATFEEAYLPYTWAKITVIEGTVPDDIVVTATGVWYGKYLVIGDKHFTGSLREAPVFDGVTYTNQTIKYQAEGIDDLYAWLRSSETNCKWYYEQVTTDKAYVAKADWSKSGYQTAGKKTSTGTLGFIKSTTGYWPASDTSLGWKGNLEAVTKAIKGTKMDANVDALTKDETNKYWVIGGITSGATLVDFKDYYRIAKLAYDKAVTKK